MKVVILAVMMALSSLAYAGVSCNDVGAAPTRIDPTLAPGIIKWVSGVERQFKLRPPESAKEAMNLQALIAKWEDQAPPGSVDSFFRAAVGHGVNVQYETFMLEDDLKNHDKHQFFINLEAARADACLALTRD